MVRDGSRGERGTRELWRSLRRLAAFIRREHEGEARNTRGRRLGPGVRRGGVRQGQTGQRVNSSEGPGSLTNVVLRLQTCVSILRSDNKLEGDEIPSTSAQDLVEKRARGRFCTGAIVSTCTTSNERRGDAPLPCEKLKVLALLRNLSISEDVLQRY